MRLTLRTMLAYLDDILEPDDSEEINKKIEESEFASNLVHRTRDVMRRIRLGVPPLTGRGLGADPNTVAEYLDNTLSGDRVPEFERICLESDAHLAEVAACHQVLTLVLGEPAEIDPEARQRMYRLAAHVDAPPVQRDPVRQIAGAPALPAPRRAKPEVPEYLRESRSRFWPVAATVLVAALLTCAALMVVGPAQWRDRALAWMPFSQDDDTTDDAEAVAEETPVAGATDVATNAPAATGEAPSADAAPPATSPPADDTEAAAAAPPETVEAPDVAPKVADNPPATTPETAPQPDATDTPPAADVPPPDRIAAKTDMPAKGELADAPAAAPESFGRFHSQHGEVLLKYDATTGDWLRLPAMSGLVKGDRLLSLPTFRPMITLSSSISIRADGPALLELVGWTDDGVPIVAVEFGRLMLMTVGKPSNALQLKLDEREPLLTFVDAESTAALEVRRVLPPGRDPHEGLAPMVADLYVTSGSVRVRDDGGSFDLQAPSRRSLFGGGESSSVSADFPKWVSGEVLPEIDRQAALFLEPLLPTEKPLVLTLKEYADHKRREVRSLAARSLCYLGNFESCTLELNESRFKALWPIYFDELKAAVARSPQTAEQVKTTLEKERGADAAALYRMLWGYSSDDLKNGADRDLVEGLDNESMDIRVLSFQNLRTLANATFGYQPEEPTAKRQNAMRAWRKALKDGRISPRTSSTGPKAKTSKTGKSAS